MSEGRVRLPPLHWVVLGAVAMVSLLVLFVLDPARSRIYPVCLFHRVTGLLCPGCGGLRAAHQLLHGHLRAAYDYNPLAVISLPLGAAWWLWWKLRARAGRPVRALPPALVWVFLALTLAFFALRNLPLGAPVLPAPPG